METSKTLIVPVIKVTDAETELIRRLLAPEATDDEFALYIRENIRNGVHPLDRMIYFTKFEDHKTGKKNMVLMCSIGFLHSRAAMSGEYAGVDDTVYGGTVGASNFTATSTVYRLVQGIRCPFTYTAHWTEFNDPKKPIWNFKPRVMLGKCSRAGATRMAFPQETGKLYTEEELDLSRRMAGATDITPPPSGSGKAQDPTSPPGGPGGQPQQQGDPAPINTAQLGRLWAIAAKCKVKEDAIKAHLVAQYGLPYIKGMPRGVYEKVIKWIEEGGNEPGSGTA